MSSRYFLKALSDLWAPAKNRVSISNLLETSGSLSQRYRSVGYDFDSGPPQSYLPNVKAKSRHAKLISRAEDVFENREEAARWLNTTLDALGGKKPLELADTEAGAREVKKSSVA